jgi:hypothetical protein
VPFIFGEAEKKAFETLKEDRFTSKDAVSAVFNPKLLSILTTDASGVAVVVVLSQEHEETETLPLSTRDHYDH